MRLRQLHRPDRGAPYLRFSDPGHRVTHSYFGHDEFARFAPPLKSLPDATAIRNRILLAFEQAEAEEDPARHRDLLTFVLVGVGPTGVEMAGAIAVLVHATLPAEFRRVNPVPRCQKVNQIPDPASSISGWPGQPLGTIWGRYNCFCALSAEGQETVWER